MSRVNVYAKVTSDSGRIVGIGGRGAQDHVAVHLNTDNAKGTAALTVTAAVLGPGLRSAERRKKGSDQRRTVFDVSLPRGEEAGDWELRLHASNLPAVAERIKLPDGRSLNDLLLVAFAAGAEKMRDKIVTPVAEIPSAEIPRTVRIMGCNVCGDQADVASGTRCGRVEPENWIGPCPGTYLPVRGKR